MSSDGIDVLRAGYEAFGRGDVPTVLESFDPAIEWVAEDVFPWGGTFRGHEEVAGCFMELGKHWTALSVKPVEFIDAGDTIVARVHVTGAAPGGSFDHEVLHLWRMSGENKAIAFREYGDTAVLQSALGG